jgi:predicted membrane protein
MPLIRAILTSRLLRTATISGGITVVLAAIAAFSGITPASASEAARVVDTEVIVFLVPLVALMAAITAQALRMTLGGTRPDDAMPARAPRAWRPGHGEG